MGSMLRTMRAAVVAGFCLIGGIWLFAGYYFTGRMADLERRSSAINARYTQAQELLSNAQSQVLLGSVYVRDALLDPNPSTAEDYRKQLEAIYESADEALRGYVPVFDEPGETQRIAELRHEIDDFRRTLLEVLRTDSGQWPREARNLLRQRIMPKRQGVLKISEEVRALNRGAFVQQQAEFASLYRTAERRVWESFGIALLASLGIALAAILYAGRLEKRIERQRLTEMERTRDLERLSSQLLTAQEAERRSIARELHDEVGQVLTAIKVELSLAQRALEASGVRPDALESVRSITDGALHTVRDLSRLLHPAMLDDLGLVATIDTYLKGFGKRHGIRIDLVQDGMDERLAADLEAGVYRIVQEALTNVVRHAQANSCRIYLQRLTNTVVVTIEDDGIGFSVEGLHVGNASRGLGLIGIRERVAQMRGELRLESTPGHGTRLTIEVPSRMREEPANPEDALSA
jgi:signal transduction histidine kinase